MKIQIVFFTFIHHMVLPFYITVYTMYSTGFKNTTPQNFIILSFRYSYKHKEVRFHSAKASCDI